MSGYQLTEISLGSNVFLLFFLLLLSRNILNVKKSSSLSICYFFLLSKAGVGLYKRYMKLISWFEIKDIFLECKHLRVI